MLTGSRRPTFNPTDREIDEAAWYAAVRESRREAREARRREEARRFAAACERAFGAQVAAEVADG